VERWGRGPGLGVGKGWRAATDGGGAKARGYNPPPGPDCAPPPQYDIRTGREGAPARPGRSSGLAVGRRGYVSWYGVLCSSTFRFGGPCSFSFCSSSSVFSSNAT